MGNFLKPLLKIYINRISWITCSDASTLFDYSIVDPGFTQGTANLQLGGWVGEKCSLFDPVSAVKSHYRGNCFCSTLISYQLGLGCGKGCSFGFVSKLKEASFQKRSAPSKDDQIFQRSSVFTEAAKSSEECKNARRWAAVRAAPRGAAGGSAHTSVLSAQSTAGRGSPGTSALRTCQALKSAPSRNEGAEYFSLQTDVKSEI